MLVKLHLYLPIFHSYGHKVSCQVLDIIINFIESLLLYSIMQLLINIIIIIIITVINTF